MNFLILFLFLGAAIALAEIHQENDPQQYKPHRAILENLNSLLYVFHLQLFLFGVYCGKPSLLFDYLTPCDLVDTASTRLELIPVGYSDFLFVPRSCHID